MSDRYFIAKGRHLVVPVTKQEYEDHWDKKRKEPITEEEWFCNLPTEEKAKVIYNLIMHEGNTEWYEDLLIYREDTMDYCADYHLIEKWLKQPHKEENIK